MTKDIILKLKESNLLGRGGAGFPTWLKWDLVKKAKGDKKYVICNASEGEPCVFKDKHIIKNYPEEMINGIVLAMKAVGSFEAWIYLNKDYYLKYSNNLKKIIGKKKINLFKKTGGYIGGEESALCESIEGNRVEPRFKPPYLAEKGLFGYPTLVNNVETFYYASKVDKEEYNQTRFYSINGDVLNPGVYELEESLTMEEILKKTENYPSFDFFVQSGGGAAGEIFLREELKIPCSGAGSITVYNKLKTDPFKLMEKWIEFFACGNCDKCLPCREGTYRLMEMIKRRKLNEEIMEQILFSLGETSFCALGRGIPVPFRSFLKKVMEIDL
jgi:NADH:ubiquinone oxidoreductase subunit F (NADH-binding)